MSTTTASDTNYSSTDTQGNMSQGLKIINEQYQLTWTPEVVFRVTTIVAVMVLTLIGNTTLITIITFHRKLRRKRVNVFLVNLAVGDLMVCLVTMTTEILFVAFGEWIMGAIACKLIVYGQIVTLASATFLLTAMSIDRYQVLVRPLQALAGQPKIWRKVLIAWIMAFIFATPQLFIFVQTDEGVRPDGHVKHLCRSKGYTDTWQRKVYFSFLTTYILVIPTIIMSFCYINIIKVVWMRTDSKKTPKPKFRIRFSPNRRLLSSWNHTSNNVDHELTMVNPYAKDSSENFVHEKESSTPNKLSIPKKLVSSSKRNVVKMTLSVIMGFVICWTPYFLVGLIRIFSDYEIKLHDAYAAAEIMALVHSALNPILYGIFSTKAAKKVCSSMCHKCKRSKQITINYETTALSDEDVTWAETRFTRVHHGNEESNTNCNASTKSESPTRRIRDVIGVIKGRFSSKKDKQPVTRVVSHRYVPLLKNDRCIKRNKNGMYTGNLNVAYSNNHINGRYNNTNSRDDMNIHTTSFSTQSDQSPLHTSYQSRASTSQHCDDQSKRQSPCNYKKQQSTNYCHKLPQSSISEDDKRKFNIDKDRPSYQKSMDNKTHIFSDSGKRK